MHSRRNIELSDCGTDAEIKSGRKGNFFVSFFPLEHWLAARVADINGNEDGEDVKPSAWSSVGTVWLLFGDIVDEE